MIRALVCIFFALYCIGDVSIPAASSENDTQTLLKVTSYYETKAPENYLQILDHRLGVLLYKDGTVCVYLVSYMSCVHIHVC